MKAIGKILFAVGLSMLFAWPAKAEFRQWTDAKGKTIVADFVRLELDSVVLRRKDGSTFKITLDSLSDKDRSYALLMVPPEVDIRVASNVDRKIAGYLGTYENSYRVQYEVINPVVTVKKTSPTPYQAPLSLQLVVIGRVTETGRYVVLDNEGTTFSFTAESRNQYIFHAISMDLQQLKGSLKVGTEYDGYLVVVRDRKGEIIQTKASRSVLAENTDSLLKAKMGTFLSNNMKPVRVRNPARSLDDSSLPGRLY